LLIFIYKQVLYYSRAVFLINIAQIKHREFPFKAMYFLGVRGLTTLSYMAYDYTTSGHVDQKSTYVLYTGCPGRNVPDFGRMFLKLKYTDLTKNTYIRS